jgi:hypothetical protein
MEIDSFHPYYFVERKERQFQVLTSGWVPRVRLDLLDGEQTKSFPRYRLSFGRAARRAVLA